MGARPRAPRHPAGRVRPTKAAREAAAPGDLTLRAAATLPTFLPSQRWFGAKARPIAEAVLRDHAAVPGTDGRLALFDVAYADGGRETYLVPVAPGAGDAPFADGLDRSVFCLALVELIRRAGSLSGQRGTFRFTPTEAFGDLLPEPPGEASRVRA